MPGGVLAQDELLMQDLNTVATLVSYYSRAARLKVAAPPIAIPTEAKIPISTAPSFWERH